MDLALAVLAFAAALGCATVGGIFYAFSSFVMRALDAIAPAHGVAAMQSINRVVITPSFLLVFVGSALACALLAAGSLLWWPEPSGPPMLAGAVLYLAGSFGLTMAMHQPMNLALGRSSPADAVEAWPYYVERWTRWNHVRTAASLLSSALFVVALLLRR